MSSIDLYENLYWLCTALFIACGFLGAVATALGIELHRAKEREKQWYLDWNALRKLRNP